MILESKEPNKLRRPFNYRTKQYEQHKSPRQRRRDADPVIQEKRRERDNFFQQLNTEGRYG